MFVCVYLYLYIDLTSILYITIDVKNHSCLGPMCSSSAFIQC